MTVKDNESVRLYMKAAKDNDYVLIDHGAGYLVKAFVGKELTEELYNPKNDTIKIYGNLAYLQCSTDGVAAITGISFSEGLTNLTHLSLAGNSLQTLDVSKLTNLTWLNLADNNLQTLDVSKLTNLAMLICSYNNLQTLNVSGLTNLQKLHCPSNSLQSLDVSNLTNLRGLECSGNKFTTQAIDDIYCALPQRQPADNAKICPIWEASDAEAAIVKATNANIAKAKNWRVITPVEQTEIKTTGKYVCNSTSGIEHIAPQHLSLYPNPASNAVTVSISDNLQGETMQIIDMFGRVVRRQRLNDISNSIDVSSLSSGMYFVRMGSEVKKLIVK